MIQESVSDLQQNGRAAIDEIASKIRMAGYGVPEGLEAMISRSGIGTSDPDSITLVFLHEPLCTVSTAKAMTQPSAELQCAGDVGCFKANEWYYIWDPNSKSGEFFVATKVRQSSAEILHGSMPLSKALPLSKAYPVGSRILKFDAVTYFIDNWSCESRPVLMRQGFNDWPDVYADNICDLQIRYQMTDGSVLDTFALARYVRQVDIAVVARSRSEDLLLEGYRYDTLRTSVQVRNLSF
jgi:hypothetical protein